MSPLPEKESNGTVYTSTEERIRHFLTNEVGPDEHFAAGVWLPDKKELVKFFESIGVNFSSPLEDYSQGDKEHGFSFHRIFSTNVKGVYLDLVFDKLESHKNPEQMLKGTKKNLLHIYGENLSKEYINSITTQ